jgi:DNA-binding XRE family transcriptional regulator
MPKRKLKSSAEKMALREAAFEMASKGELPWPQALKVLRLSIDMTQGQFGKMFKLTQRQISEFEAGKSNPNVETLNKIGRPFGLKAGLVPIEK